jgi:hypothetical protein
MATQRRRGLARWLVIGISGLATAGFLGAIVNQAAVQETAAPAPVQDLSVITTQQPAPQQISSDSGSAGPQSQANGPTVVRGPRFRTRGS